MNKLDLRKAVIILLLIIAAFGLIFFSEWISFEALKENRAEISEFFRCRAPQWPQFQVVFYLVLAQGY